MGRSKRRRPDYSGEGQSPYEEGREAYERGLDLIENPYSKSRQPVPHRDWIFGWMDAKEEGQDDSLRRRSQAEL